MKIVALLTVRNEELYLARCLQHLHEQGIATCVIDNESTDSSLDIATAYKPRGVFRIERQAYPGYFDLVAQLGYKEHLAQDINADWYIHLDADEIREAPIKGQTLHEAICAADRQGFNSINFDEFTFLPPAGSESFEATDYVDTMRHYYFFQPGPLRRVNAWKNTGQTIDLVSKGGHQVLFEGQRIYPQNFIMRHYIVLSTRHAIAKYTRERIYSETEIRERRWHGMRARFTADKLNLPESSRMKCIDTGEWDRSDPWLKHTFLGD